MKLKFTLSHTVRAIVTTFSLNIKKNLGKTNAYNKSLFDFDNFTVNDNFMVYDTFTVTLTLMIHAAEWVTLAK